jgi:hypothetical protein
VALVATCRGILRKSVSPGLDADRYRALYVIEIRQHNEHIVSAGIGVSPTLGNARIEKVCEQTVRVTRRGILFFEYASSLEFGETFQLVAGKSVEKIQNNKSSIHGNCGPKKGTDQRRARGDSGQN